MKPDYKKVLESNVVVHSKVAKNYKKEPHFREENVKKVSAIVGDLAKETEAKSALDLGCGTGFMINILKQFVGEIDGVDATQAMLDEVDKSGKAKIQLHCHDTGSFKVKEGHYDLVTAYSFLHHLYEIESTLGTAFRGLRKGGMLYVDLEPNYFFWKELTALSDDEVVSEVVQVEMKKLKYQDGEVATQLGVDPDLFNQSEYGKNVKGGFEEEKIRKSLSSIGFSRIKYFYHWFVGQAAMINQPSGLRDTNLRNAQLVDSVLQQGLPLSRGLFKYVGFIATK